VARFFIGLTDGWFTRGHSMEDIRDHWDEIRSEEGYTVPAGPNDEFEIISKVLKGA
jgi:hypothetical protein